MIQLISSPNHCRIFSIRTWFLLLTGNDSKNIICDASVRHSCILSRVKHYLFPQGRPGFKPGSIHLGFVVDKVALGQGFSEYFGFPCQSLFRQFLHNQHHVSSGADTIGRSTQSPTAQIKKNVSIICHKLELVY
jgi:hypothetical protein